MRALWVTALVCGVVLLGFQLWYTAGSPLTEAEIERYTARIDAGGAGADERARMLGFMRSDDGQPIVMLNLVRHHERAHFADGDRGMTGDEADAVYGRAVMPELFRRASHPLIVAWPAARLGELHGAAPELDFIGAVRYRSRRDLLDMATSERWNDIAEYKFAGLAYNALRPSRIAVSLSDPRLSLAVAILVVGAITRLARRGRRPWLLLTVLMVPYGLFCLWYGSEAPLSSEEIDSLLARIEERRPGEAPVGANALRRFAETDDGGAFYNINLNRFRAEPVYADDRETDLTSRETNALYSRVAGPTVVRNAGHPSLMLHPVGKLGPDGHELAWDDVNFVRYRSRRRLLEMVASDAWDDVAVHKFAALESATAYPSPGFQVPDPCLVLLGLSALAILGIPARTRRGD
jgi:hypothetical protein